LAISFVDSPFTIDFGPSKYLAPEILTGSIEESEEADVFAFGMVAAEVLTHGTPFEVVLNRFTENDTLHGCRPDIPKNPEDGGLAENTHELLKRCWEKDPNERPKIQEVVEKLEKLVGGGATMAFPSHRP
jgi:tyrosine-protein kinase Yes